MTERPILFSGEMVRALIAGRKTQTRRLVRPLTTAAPLPATGLQLGAEVIPWRGVVHSGGWGALVAEYNGGTTTWPLPRCPYGAPGDQLWVRETHAQFAVGNRSGTAPQCVAYRATRDTDGSFDYVNNGDEVMRIRVTRWTPAIHMPRWASRLSLRVTDVRVERLQAITEQDAVAEGISCVTFRPDDGFPLCDGYMVGADDGKTPLAPSAREAFAKLWDSINGDRAAWASNPWVWAVSFEVVR